MVISLLAVGVGAYYKVPVTVVNKKFFKLMTAALVFSFFLSLFLYIKSRFVPQSKLAVPGNSGKHVDETATVVVQCAALHHFRVVCLSLCESVFGFIALFPVLLFWTERLYRSELY